MCYSIIVTLILLLFTSCKKASDDLTIGLTGEYIGNIQSTTLGKMDDYVIRVTKVDDDIVAISPKSGIEFMWFETKLVRQDTNVVHTNTHAITQGSYASFSNRHSVSSVSMQTSGFGGRVAFLGEKQ